MRHPVPGKGKRDNVGKHVTGIGEESDAIGDDTSGNLYSQDQKAEKDPGTQLVARGRCSVVMSVFDNLTLLPKIPDI